MFKETTSIEQNDEPKIIEITPINKWKRFLLYFCDLVIVFFGSVVIFSLAAIPISKSISGFEAVANNAEVALDKRNDILIDNEILYRKGKSVNLSLEHEYTFEQYARFLTASSYEITNPDVFKTFYFNIRNYSQTKFNEDLLKCDSIGFFDKEQLSKNVVALNKIYVDQFKPKFNGDELLNEAKTNYLNFYNVFYLNFYSYILNDIKINDLKSSKDDISYNAYQETINSYTNLYNNIEIADIYISFALSCIIFYLIIPLINKNNKTISMICMKIERINCNTLELKKKSSVVGNFIYNVATNLWATFFMGIISVGLSYCFNLPILVPLSVSSLIICVISLFFLIFDEYNRPLSDKFSNGAIVTTEGLDEIYRNRGYEI